MGKNDIVSVGCGTRISENNSRSRTPVSKDDRIRCIESCVRELSIEPAKLSTETAKVVDQRGAELIGEAAKTPGHYKWGDVIADYGVWLLKERDGRKWGEIAIKFFGSADNKFKMRVRLAHARIEREYFSTENLDKKPRSETDEAYAQGLLDGWLGRHTS
jgi:hypothetical protein